MNELNDVGRINTALARRYGGQTPLIFTMASDTFPVIPISDTLCDPELHWLMQSRLCSANASDPADAGNQSSVGLNNPAGSGVLAVLEEVHLYSATANMLLVMTMAVTTTPDGTTQGFIRDGRGWPATALRAVCQVVIRTAAFSTTTGQFQIGAANTSVVWKPPAIVLTPGSRLTIAGAAVNQGITGTFYWRERPATDGELGE